MDVSDTLGGGSASSPEFRTPYFCLDITNTCIERLEDLSLARFEEHMARKFAVRPEHVRFFICLLAGYPLGLIYHTLIEPLERRTSRLLFIALTGFALIAWMFGTAAVHPLVAVFTVHSILTHFRGRLAVFLTFSFTMTQLTYIYWTARSSSAGRLYAMNLSLPQCVLTLRLIGVAFDLLDGARASKQLMKDGESPTNADRDQYPNALSTPPSLLELLAYVFFFSGSLAGPQFSMRRFQRFVNRELIPQELKSGIVPDCILFGLSRVLIGALHLVLYLAGTHFIPDDYLLSADFDGLPMWLKIFYMIVWGKVFLYKYTSCWLIQEGGCIVSGLAYSGPGVVDTQPAAQSSRTSKTASTSTPATNDAAFAEARSAKSMREGFHMQDLELQTCWQACANVHVLQQEITSSCTGIIESFNVTTNRWISMYIYKRLRWLGSRLLSHLVSLVFLAFWHGLYSGYLVAFVYEFLIINTERLVHGLVKSDSHLAELVARPGVRLALWPIQKAIVLYAGATMYVAFNFLHFDLYWKVLASLKFSGFYYIPAIPVLLLLSLLIPAQPRDQKGKNH